MNSSTFISETARDQAVVEKINTLLSIADN